ncbi:hypothetical protein ACFTAO_39360 [Paenibacillus rhizoplanae]
MEKDGSQLNGLAAIQLEKEYSQELAGTLTEERVTKDIAAYQALFSNPEQVIKDGNQVLLKDDMYARYVLPYFSYYKLIDDAFFGAAGYR